MNFIDNIQLSRLRNNDYFQYMADVKGLVAQATPATLNVEDESLKFDNKFTELDQTLNVDRGSVLTEKIQELDAHCDNTWTSLNERVKATLFCPIPKEVEAAKHLKRVFDLYGNIRRLSLKEQTAAATNLYNDLKVSPHAENCQTIGIVRWVSAYENETIELNNLLNERDSEKAAKTTAKVKEVRLAFDPVYTELVNRVNAMVTLRMNTPEMDIFIKEVNQKIKNIEHKMALRQGHRDNGEEETPDTPNQE